MLRIIGRPCPIEVQISVCRRVSGHTLVALWVLSRYMHSPPGPISHHMVRLTPRVRSLSSIDQTQITSRFVRCREWHQIS